MMDRLISLGQTAFLSKRKLVDGELVLNELVGFAKRKKHRCMLVKVDFEKAYDCASWNFLRNMMRIMGFGAKWMR